MSFRSGCRTQGFDCISNTELTFHSADMVMCLHEGPGNLVFFADAAREPPWPLPEEWNTAGLELPDCLQLFEKQLSSIFKTLKAFSLEVNTAVNTGKKLPETLYLSTMAAVMYRLALMNYETHSMDELYRIALLTFVSPLKATQRKM